MISFVFDSICVDAGDLYFYGHVYIDLVYSDGETYCQRFC